MPMYWRLKQWSPADRERVVDHLCALRRLLAASVPRRSACDTLLLATWNHLPLFAELKIDFTEQYLQRIRAGDRPLDRPRPDATER